MKTKSIVILFILFAGLVVMSYLAPKLQEGLTGQTDAQNQAEADRKSAEAAQVHSKDDLAKLQEAVSNRSDSGNNSNTTNSSSIQSGTSLYGPNGEICQVLVDEKNKQYLEVRDSIIKPPVYYHSTVNKFTGPNGSSAEVYLGVDNQPRISISDAAGNTKVFSIDGTHANTSTNYNPVDNAGSPMGSNNYNSVYSNSLPTGIPASQIVPGTEDLYILKTQVVPPVCPACPQPSLDCKKKSNKKNNPYLPYPVLNDYTSFGM